MKLLLAVLIASAPAASAAQRGEAQSLAQARREAATAEARADLLDRQARAAASAAERALAQGEAIAARIASAEANLTVAEQRIALISRIQAGQRARLAARQQPLARLTAALQTMARRPAALALVQPGSVQDTVHVRAMLAAMLPEIRRRTADLRAEVERSERLRRHAVEARAGLAASRRELGARRVELGRFEAAQRTRSRELGGLALAQSDRALAFGETARALRRIEDDRAFQARLRGELAALPPPLPRPGSSPDTRALLPYRIPVEGRLVAGVGEISDGGVHSRGLRIAPASGAGVVSPARGRIAFAAPFRRYGMVVIIDHGQGWSTVVTDLASLSVRQGQIVARGQAIGQAARGEPQLSIELRRHGRPVPFAHLVSG